MIANASWGLPEGADENAAPVLVDHGQLNFATNTLVAEDLRDYSRSSQSGGGIQAGFGIGQYSGDNQEHYVGTGDDRRGKNYLSGSTTLSVQSGGHRMEGETRATIGAGNIIVGGVSLNEQANFARLNRDIDKAQETLVDQQTSALNGSLSVDHRWLSEVGRQVIKDDHVNLWDNSKATIGGLAGDTARVGAAVASVGQITQLGNSLNTIDGVQGAVYKDDGELAAHVEAFRDGNIEDAVKAQELLNTLDAAMNEGNGSRVRVTEGAFNPDGNSVAGAANRETNTLYADMGENARGSIINTLAHEGMHLSGAGEWMTGVTGYLADFTYRVNAWANSSAINSHGVIHIPVQDWGKHNHLLENNWKQYAYDASTNSLIYRQLGPAEVAFIDRKAVAFASEYFGVSDRRVSVSQLEAAKHVLQDAALWLVDDNRRRQGYGPDDRAMDYLTQSDEFGTPIQGGQWMFVANAEQRSSYWMNMAPDDPRSLAVYNAVVAAGPYSIIEQEVIHRDHGYIIGGHLRPWCVGDHMLPLSEAIDGKIYTGSRYPCYVASCIGNNYSNDPSTQALLKARDDRARSDYLMVGGLLTGGIGVAYGFVGTSPPVGLAVADAFFSVGNVANNTYTYGPKVGVWSAAAFGLGKASGRISNHANMPTIIAPSMELFVPSAIEGLARD